MAQALHRELEESAADTDARLHYRRTLQHMLQRLNANQVLQALL
jgi:hypothetical protein